MNRSSDDWAPSLKVHNYVGNPMACYEREQWRMRYNKRRDGSQITEMPITNNGMESHEV